MSIKPGAQAARASLDGLARGRETQRRNRDAGKPRNRKPTLWDVTEVGVRPSPGRNFHCPRCGETLSWPASTYVCPAGRPGWIDTRGRA